MEKSETKSNILKKIDKIDLTYLGVIFAMLITIIILFFYSTNFILKNVNKIFTQTNEINSHALNMEGYSLVEKKLKLPVNSIITESSREPAQEALMDPQVTTTPVATTTTPEVAKSVLDNKSITISVLNGARKAGVAATMIAELEAAGFSKGTAGDSKTVYPITTIMLKDSKKEYKQSIEDVVKKSHPKAITKTNPTTSKFDVVVIVGKE